MGCPHSLCLQTRERARRPDRVTSETTPCLAGGIGLPRLHEAREALPPFLLSFARLGGSSSARLGTQTYPSVSSSREGWPYLSQSTTVDGAYSTFIRPHISTP